MPKITSAQRAASAAVATHGFVVENVVVAAKESPDAARTWLAKELSTLKVPRVGKDEGLEAALARWAAAAGATPAYDVVAARARLVSGAPAEPNAGAGAVEGAAARLSTLAALAVTAKAKDVRGRNDVERARTGFYAFAEEATPGAIRRVLGAGAPASDAAAWSQFKKVTTDALVARGAGTSGALAALLAQVEAAKTPPGAKDDGSSRPPPADAAAEMELHEDALYEVCSDFGAGNAADIQAALMAAIIADLGLPPGVGDSAVASAYAARARAAAGAGASSSAAAHATTEDTAFASAVAYIAKISELIRPKRRRLLLGDSLPPSAPSARPAAAASAPSAAAIHGGRAAWNPAIIVDDGSGGGAGHAARQAQAREQTRPRGRPLWRRRHAGAGRRRPRQPRQEGHALAAARRRDGGRRQGGDAGGRRQAAGAAGRVLELWRSRPQPGRVPEAANEDPTLPAPAVGHWQAALPRGDGGAGGR